MSTADAELEIVLLAREADLPGGLHVRRAIPQARRRMVGPFVFVDQMGPAEFGPGEDITVLSHPHIGLSTVTYLFEGEGVHRDSIGTVQRILPGEVNWMTAGRGIVHLEQMAAGATGRVFGVQTWVALPQDREECEPSFDHYDTSAVPVIEEGGATIRLIAGSLFGARSAVRTSSPLFYADVRLEAGAVLQLAPEYEERAAFIIDGRIALTDNALGSGEMGVLQPGATVLLRAEEPTHLLLLGGDPLDGPRYISWNFVSSSRERLEQAADDWRNQRFERIEGETSYIPLPGDGDGPVNYP